MSKEITWRYNGKIFKVGESLLISPQEENNNYPIVWFKKKLYKAIIKPESLPKTSRVGLYDIYDSNKKPYWTTIDKVFHVISI